ncbi:MAG: DUF2635 domain-containing protein [Candidatus Sedimenticola sp. (ex Thyasira tokunagai)]
MPETLTVKPAPKRQVRDPRTGEHLPKTGMIVLRTPYWLRRLKDGDVVKVKATTKKKAVSKKKAAKRTPTKEQ